ncbi:hypothetical protein [Desulfovibrio fairfieldensis]|uniref:hypothetical protein n=1 Tax=Desulfovibrio fairfieldensis TaxID=44742 RepID=UPI000A9BE2CE|nr:hypothetical protein [Desulfovibrio fairfieldensis]
MSRLLWFVLGGIATAVGAGITSVLLDDGQGGDPADDIDGCQESAIGDESSMLDEGEND